MSLKSIFFGLMLITFMSCTQRSKEVVCFDLIDVSMYNGWTDYYCLKIFKSGKVFIFNDKFKKGETYFRVNISKNEIDSISKLVEIILDSKIDTFYKRDCQDCGSYNLIIKAENKKFKSFVNGITGSNKEIKCMNNLINYLYKIAERSRDSID